MYGGLTKAGRAAKSNGSRLKAAIPVLEVTYRKVPAVAGVRDPRARNLFA